MRPEPESCTVHFTYYGKPGKTVLLTEQLAMEYITRMKLSDAIIKKCYSEDQIEWFIKNRTQTAKVIE